MIESVISWISANYIEFLAALLGLSSVIFGIKEKSFFWILTFLNAVLFVYVYFEKKIYALMLLQFYYITLSFYGFYYWIKGGKKDKNQKKVPIIHITVKQGLIGAVLFAIVYVSITFVLSKYTDSAIPRIDALITSLSIFAAFMMTKKYFEHWYLWLVSDIVSIITFANQEMYATMTMYFFLFFSSIVGYYQWNKEYKKQNNPELDVNTDS